MYSDTGNTTSLVLGFPIRTSSDPRSVGSSPRHIAASHVLHRPLMPRHPPCALKHLQTQKPIVEKSKLHHNKPHTNVRLDARNHYPRIKHHTPPPSGATTHRHHQRDATPTQSPKETPGGTGLLSQSPTVCLAVPHHDDTREGRRQAGFLSSFVSETSCTRPGSTTEPRPSNESPRSPNPHTMWAGHGSRGAP
jgi:hypothetical protein